MSSYWLADASCTKKVAGLISPSDIIYITFFKYGIYSILLKYNVQVGFSIIQVYIEDLPV